MPLTNWVLFLFASTVVTFGLQAEVARQRERYKQFDYLVRGISIFAVFLTLLILHASMEEFPSSGSGEPIAMFTRKAITAALAAFYGTLIGSALAYRFRFPESFRKSSADAESEAQSAGPCLCERDPQGQGAQASVEAPRRKQNS
jgi:hypothetical protein